MPQPLTLTKGLPVPEDERLRYPFASMAVGDSFFVLPEGHQTLHNVCCSLRRCSQLPSRAHMTFAIRIDRTHTPAGVRCWRTK